MSTDDMEFDIWLQNGVARGWVSEPVCSMHGTIPINTAEYAAMEQDNDPCVPVVRLWGAGKADA